jgi:hypothetical protein
VTDPKIERRAVDHSKTIRCPHCGWDADIPREDPWIIAGDQQHAPMLVAFTCPYGEHAIEIGAP